MLISLENDFRILILSSIRYSVSNITLMKFSKKPNVLCAFNSFHLLQIYIDITLQGKGFHTSGFYLYPSVDVSKVTDSGMFSQYS